MGEQFSNISATYGAPTGRYTFGLAQNCEAKTARIFLVMLDSGGYDDGGAYWGLGEKLYCCKDGGNYREFVRAKNRFEAMLAVGLESWQMKNVPPLPWAYSLQKLGARWTITRPDDFLQIHDTKAAAYMAAVADYQNLQENAE